MRIGGWLLSMIKVRAWPTVVGRVVVSKGPKRLYALLRSGPSVLGAGIDVVNDAEPKC